MAPEQCFISLFKNQKNLDYTTADLYSPIVDIKADILDLPKNAKTNFAFPSEVSKST